MGYRHNECLAKVGDAEPIFVLRAQDKLAPMIIRLWADLAAHHGCESGKVREALNLAAKMQEWGRHNETKYPD